MKAISSSTVITALAAFCCVMLVALLATADQKRCPVCHEVFDTHVHICPNDGTDLKLLGETIRESGNGGNETAPQPDADPDDGQQPPTVPSDDDSPGAADGPEDDTHKYIRQDRGGRRRRVDHEVGDDWDDRSDRLRRLQDERAGMVVVRKKEMQPRFDSKKDTLLRSQYRIARDKWLSSNLPPPETIYVKASGTDEEKALWEQAAPLMSIGTRISWMGEASRPGPVLGAEIDLNMLRSNIRVGFSSFIGVRSVFRHELIFLESVSLGVQHPWRFSPYLVGRVGIGAIVGQRFGEDITALVRGLGFDAGVDCRVNDAIVITPSVGYVRYGVRGATWDSVVMKIALGF